MENISFWTLVVIGCLALIFVPVVLAYPKLEMTFTKEDMHFIVNLYVTVVACGGLAVLLLLNL